MSANKVEWVNTRAHPATETPKNKRKTIRRNFVRTQRIAKNYGKQANAIFKKGQLKNN